MQVQTPLVETIRGLISKSEYDKAADTFLKETNTRLTVKYKTYGKHFPGDKDSRDIYRVTISRNISGKVRKMSFDFGQSLNDTALHGLRYSGDMSLLKPEFKNLLIKYGFNENGYNVENTPNPAKVAAILETIKSEYSRLMYDMYLTRLISEFDEQVEKDKNNKWSNEALKNRVFFHKLPKDKQQAIKAKLADTAEAYTQNAMRGVMEKFTEINQQRKAPGAYSILACLTKYDPGTFEDFCSNYGYDTDSRQAEKTYKAVCKEYESLTRLYDSEELEAMAEIQ